MQVVNQPVCPLDDACIRCHVFALDAPGLFNIMRRCCTAWCQSLPQCTRNFGQALRLLSRLSVRSLFVNQYCRVAGENRCQFGHMPHAEVERHRNELNALGNLLWCSQNPNVPNLVWQHQHLIWIYLKMGSVDYAWEVRKEAALILRDLCTLYRYGDIERKLVALHDEAWTVFRNLPNKKRGPSEVYEALEPLSLKFKTIQFNAALVAGDHEWLLHNLHECHACGFLFHLRHNQ